MSKLKQKNRPIAIDVKGLGEDVLILTRMSGSEELGRPFRYELDLVSEQPEEVDFDNIISENVTIRLRTEDGDQRYFNGFVSRLSQTRWEGNLVYYKAVIVPWLWFLTRTADCRIFQDMTVPDIIKQVFDDHGYSDIEDALSGDYRTWEYCVQYRETAFAFVSRLMEQEGIYYFFSHEKDNHKLVLADSPAAHEDIAGTAQVPYHPRTAGKIHKPHVSDLAVDQELLPGTYAVSDFDFTNPKKQLRKTASPDHDHTVADGDFYDCPGEYTDYEHAETYSRIRMEELHTRVLVTRCVSDARTISVGATYELTDYPDPLEKYNKKYLIIAATHELTSDIVQELENTFDEPLYRCRFSAIDAGRQFRLARTTPRPHIRGPQTAIVVGPDDTEIHPDKYGRVKVEFHWDHRDSDDKSSCWIRVSQNWAGKKWGGMFIPHKGHEVIVDFIEGDPDRPIITGRVYNADNMPPNFENESGEMKGLPDNKHKSIIRDDYGNEIVLDATPDKEHIRIHSPNNTSTVAMGEDWLDFTLGNKNEWIVGTKTELGVGFNFELFAGSSMDVTLLSKTEITAGVEKTCNIGARLSINLADEVDLCAGDYKQHVRKEIVLDSEKASYMIGGPNNNAQLRLEGNKSGPGSIVISYSDKGSERDKKAWMKWAMGGLAAGGAAAHVLTTATTAGTMNLNDPGWRAGMSAASGVVGGAAILTADVALATLIFLYQQQKEPPENKIPDSEIKLDKDGMEIVSGKSEIKIKKDGSIEIQSEGPLKITSKKGLDLKSTGAMSVESDAQVNLKGIFTHKNINILK